MTDNFTINDFNKPHTIIFSTGGISVSLHPNGGISHEGYTPAEAAQAFWSAVSNIWPCQKVEKV